MHHEPAQARRALPRRRATPHEGPPPSASPRRVTAACPRVPRRAVPVPVQAENVREQRKELREEACGWDPKYARIHTHTRTHTYFQTISRVCFLFVCLDRATFLLYTDPPLCCVQAPRQDEYDISCLNLSTLPAFLHTEAGQSRDSAMNCGIHIHLDKRGSYALYAGVGPRGRGAGLPARLLQRQAVPAAAGPPCSPLV